MKKLFLLAALVGMAAFFDAGASASQAGHYGRGRSYHAACSKHDSQNCRHRAPSKHYFHHHDRRGRHGMIMG